MRLHFGLKSCQFKPFFIRLEITFVYFYTLNDQLTTILTTRVGALPESCRTCNSFAITLSSTQEKGSEF